MRRIHCPKGGKHEILQIGFFDENALTWYSRGHDVFPDRRIFTFDALPGSFPPENTGLDPFRHLNASTLADAITELSSAICLIGDKLFTFKRPEDLARGWYTEVLELESADYLVEWDVVPNIHNVKQIEGKYAFEIGTDAETPARREWMFAVDTDVERRRWVHTLGSFCKQVWRPDETGLEGQLRILRVKSTKDTPQKTYLMHSDGRAPIIGDGDNSENGFSLPSRSTVASESLDERTAKNCQDSTANDKIIDLTCLADQNHTCSICFKDLENEKVWELTCGHYFCLDCIKEWSKFKRTCPVCREVF
ncbi:hypothetical protein FOZ61_010577 [Perkinsus olseni]|uniref:RING-type domain-containing protein n=2 Tax=Perkinsus olseni TaxID=32597 RepID=A0A7J6KVG9_PEROL|nr:hypothetical protein FOZ61_010577 [Perkinsus olseni]